LITLQEKILFKNSNKYSRPIALIKSGRLLIVKKKGTKWFKVATGDYVGWINNEYLWGY
jgi:SH3-like domain-containing protein